MGRSLRAGRKVYEAVLERPGRCRVVVENLWVKEVTVGNGERVLAELATLAEVRRSTAGPAEGGHRKRECALRASRRYGQYLKTRSDGSLAIDRKKVEAAQRRDGMFVMHDNDDTLRGEDMALGYRQLQRVEQAWRSLKSGLRLRPVYHWAPQRIRPHVTVTVLALLERMAEQACGDSWRHVANRLKRIQLAQLFGGEKTVWQVTKVSQEARNLLTKLDLDEPDPILRID